MRREPVYVRRRRIAAFALVLVLVLVAGVSSALAGRGFFGVGSVDSSKLRPGPSSSATSGATPATTSTRAGSVNVYAHIASADMSSAVAGIPARVYVPNSKSESVDVIDPATYKVIAHFGVGEYPQHITPSWDLKHLYVDNTLSNTLIEIDPKTGRPTRTIPVFDPYNLYFTPDGSKAIVVVETTSRVDFRNPHTWKLIKRVFIPAPGPNHLDFSADGRFFLISGEFSGYVVRVSTVSMRVTGRVWVGGLPVDVRLSPDGKVFYVANQGLGGVSVLSAKTMKVLKFIKTGRGTHGFVVGRDGSLLYLSNRLAGTISVIDFTTRRVTATWKVGGSPDMMQLTPDGKQLWVSNRFDGTVSVIDASTGHVLHVIRVGKSPHGISLFPQPGRHSLGHNGIYR